MFEDADIVHRYTRAEAIADEVLRDVSAQAAEYGFRHPFAIAQHAWNEAIHWPEDGGHGQDETGRLYDVLIMAHLAVAAFKRAKKDVDRVEFTVVRVVDGSDDPEPQPLTLTLHIGPGDEGEPVITVMHRRDM